MKLCIAIVGPTASGKSSFALELATKLGGEIVSMDSTAVYKGFDIGSAKPSAKDRERVPHHLIDILNPQDPFSAGHFVQRADEVIEEIQSRNRLPLLVGGTYFYLRALQHGMFPTPVIPAEVLENIEKEFFEEESSGTQRMHQELQKKDPKAAENIHPNDRYRLVRALAILRTSGDLPSELKAQPQPHQTKRLWLKYALLLSRHQINQNIVHRTEKMLQAGLVEETRRIWEIYPQARALGSVGYAEAAQFLQKKITEKQLRNEIIEKTRQLSKRQVTWLRSDPEVRYVDFRDYERVLKEIENLKFVLGS